MRGYFEYTGGKRYTLRGCRIGLSLHVNAVKLVQLSDLAVADW